ncbi:MAG: polysaccharide deacetylase family protein, partial [bacterium]
MCRLYFTIDLEEWWAVHSFQNYFRDHPNHYSDRIEEGLENILHLLKRYNQSATFFVLGRIAKKYPQLIKRIVDEGYDLGTHGYGHELVYEMSEKEFEKDLVQSIKILQDISGLKIDKYRAPSYSITKNTLWALPVLYRNGIRIDSSIASGKNFRYGIRHASRQPYKIKLNEEDYIIEIPPNSLDFKMFSLPVTSGFGFRFFPLKLISRSIKNFRKNSISPIITLHNWEFDTDHPKIKAGTIARMIHYYNLQSVENKVKQLFSIYKFQDMRELPLTDKI